MSILLNARRQPDRTDSPNNTVQNPGYRSGSNIGASLVRLGGAIDQIADVEAGRIKDLQAKAEADLKAQKAAQDAVRANQIMAQFQIETAEDLAGTLEAYDGQSDIRTGFDERLIARRDTFLEGVGDNEALRRIVAPQLETHSGRARLNALTGETQGRARFTADGVVEAADLSANGVRSGLVDVNDAVDKVRLLAAAVPEARRGQLIDASTAKIYGAYIERRVEQDAPGFKKALHDGEFDDVFTPSQKSAALARADQAMQSRKAEARAAAAAAKAAQEAERRTRFDQIRWDMEDHLASIEGSGVGLDGFDTSEFEAIFGKKDAARRLKQLRRQEAGALARYEARQGMPNMSRQELAEHREKHRPQPGAAGFKDAAKLYADIAAQEKAIVKARETDPVAFMLTGPTLSPLRDAAFGEVSEQQDGEPDADFRARLQTSRARYLDTVASEQERLGIAPENRRVLAVAEAEEWIKRLSNGSPADRRMAAARLEGIYGAKTGLVLRDLQKEGLPASYVTLVDLAMRSPAGAANLAEAISDEAEVRKVVPKSDRDRVEAGAALNLKPLIDTLAYAPGAAADVKAYTDSYNRIAQNYIAKGVSVSAAGEQAAKDILSGYAYVGSYRIPDRFAQRRVAGPSGRDVSGTQAVASGLSGITEMALPEIAPLTHTGSLSAEQLADKTAATIRRHGRWVTAAGPDGDEQLKLVLHHQGRTQAVYLKNGAPAVFDFDDVIEMGQWQMRRVAHRSSEAGRIGAGANLGGRMADVKPFGEAPPLDFAAYGAHLDVQGEDGE